MPTCEHSYDHATESFKIVALQVIPNPDSVCNSSQPHPNLRLSHVKDLEPGEEIFISYGNHDNARLLWQYGFVLPQNPQTAVQIDWDQDPGIDDPLHDTKKRLLERHGLSTPQGAEFLAYPHANGSPPPALLAKCRIMALTKEDIAGIEDAGSSLDASKQLNERNEAEAKAAISDLARMTLTRYPTTLVIHPSL